MKLYIINGDSLDNRKCNLRVADYVINAQNRKSCNRNNLMGLRNVCQVDGKYLVQFKVDGESRRFGPFDRIEEANHAANVLRDKFYV